MPGPVRVSTIVDVTWGSMTRGREIAKEAERLFGGAAAAGIAAGAEQAVRSSSAFLDLKEEEFESYDYNKDKSTKLENTIVTQGQLRNGLNIINIAKLIAKAVSSKSLEEKQKLKPSEILTYVFSDEFFVNDLALKNDQVTGFLEHIDKNLPSQQLLKTGQQFQLIDYLISESQNYIDKLNDK